MTSPGDDGWAPEERRRVLRDRPARSAVVVLAVGLAVTAALVEAFLVPLRIGTVPVPVSVLGAVLITPLLVRWAYRHSGSLLVAALPALAWAVVVVPLSVRTPSGDLVIAGTATGTAFLVLGLLACIVPWLACYARTLGAAASR